MSMAPHAAQTGVRWPAGVRWLVFPDKPVTDEDVRRLLIV
jgi:hypothetical protein